MVGTGAAVLAGWPAVKTQMVRYGKLVNKNHFLLSAPLLNERKAITFKIPVRFLPTPTAAGKRYVAWLCVCRYAFIFDYLINSYSEMKYCTTKAAASPILIQEHGLGMAEGAPFKTCINIALLKLKEGGFLQGLKKKSVARRNGGGCFLCRRGLEGLKVEGWYSLLTMIWEG